VAGADNATGEVLTFLDSHCECNVGWLEPLLDRIRQNRTNVVTPTIDSIEKETFRYVGGKDTVTRGVFTWGLTFTWLDLPFEEQRRRASPALPLASPTMAGGLFSMDRSYFYEIGSYVAVMNAI
jgi:polypeptide N-acetylgalactosaminyltransferase